MKADAWWARDVLDRAITLRPANPALEDMVFDPSDVTVFGKVVTVLRRL